jgi:hypothetical protein
MLLTIGIVLAALPGAVCAQSFLNADNATGQSINRQLNWTAVPKPGKLARIPE